MALPLGIGYGGWVLIGITDAIMLGRFDPLASSAAGLALSFYDIIITIGFGILFPVTILVSRLIESMRSRMVPKLIRQGLWVCGILSATARVASVCVRDRQGCAGVWRIFDSATSMFLLITLPLIAMVFTFPEWIVMLFIDSDTPTTGKLVLSAIPVIILAATFIVVDGLRAVANHTLAGLSDMKVPALISGIVYWGIALPAGMPLGFVMDFGVSGFWMGLILGMAIVTVCYVVRIRWVMQRARS
uniref:MatE protein n=1 Tax=Candidatus Kentrum sp. LFY TaxID=2126342 RepID=A0A450USU3_9GAMM|nr:MAG: MatE protein [Candidatus Kentron sp. LFY]VFJ95673.1 MAG: MatE protein [Candidatus Kentron sp. LFY]